MTSRVKLALGASRAIVRNVATIDDLRTAAAGRCPRLVFDYLDGGAEGEVTLRSNELAFHHVMFRPQCAVHVPEVKLSTTILGHTINAPMMLAPIGSARMIWPRQAEAVTAAAAGRAGIIGILSTLVRSICLPHPVIVTLL